jgi:hypothetical protein
MLPRERMGAKRVCHYYTVAVVCVAVSMLAILPSSSSAMLLHVQETAASCNNEESDIEEHRFGSYTAGACVSSMTLTPAHTRRAALKTSDDIEAPIAESGTDGRIYRDGRLSQGVPPTYALIAQYRRYGFYTAACAEGLVHLRAHLFPCLVQRPKRVFAHRIWLWAASAHGVSCLHAQLPHHRCWGRGFCRSKVSRPRIGGALPVGCFADPLQTKKHPPKLCFPEQPNARLGASWRWLHVQSS